jgi:hypothetical protein
MGNRIAGGMAMALPGAMAGLSLAGGLMGGRMAAFDPFTMGARGFASGVGAGGMGAMDTLGMLGSRFATGGLRAGMGALGGGLAGAAVAAAPMMAAGLAVQQVAGGVYQGVQNVSDVGNMANQYFGPQYGAPGARAGGEMGRSNIKGIVGVLHDLVGEDVTGSMKELKNLMDRAGQMGMLGGITDAQSFKQRFGQIVSQVRDLAKVMGSTLEEAGPAYFQMRQMGLWKTSDIMGTAISARIVGPQATPQLMQTMAAGAQMSHAMGGTRRAGATQGREAFMNIQAAQRAGVFSAEDVEEFTGGLAGAEGQAAVAQRMTQMTASLSQTGAGRAMMAGLGATRTENGKQVFTGEIDKERLNKFLGGQTGVEELLRQGRATASTREGAMSFTQVEGQLGQNLGSEGGMEAMVSIVQKIADTKFKGSERARHHLFRQMMGVSAREAELLGKMADDLPRIMDERARQTEAGVTRAFDEYQRKTYHSVDGLKKAFEKAYDQSMRPLNEAGERLATDMGEVVDRVTNKIMGRAKSIPMGTIEKARLIREGAMTTDFSKYLPSNMGQEFVTGSAWENVTRRVSGGGLSGAMAAGAGAGAIAGSLTGVGALATGAVGGLGSGAAFLTGIGEDMTPKARALRDIGIGQKGAGGPLDMGGGYTTSIADVEGGMRQAYMRAQNPERKGLNIDDAKIERVKGALKATVGQHNSRLSKLRKEDPKAYKDELLRLMSETDRNAMAGMTDSEKLNYLAVAQKEEGYDVGDMAVDFKAAAALAGVATDISGIKTLQTSALENMREEIGGRNIVDSALKGAAMGLAIGGVGGIVGMIGGAAMGAITGGIAAAVKDTGISEGDLQKAFGGAGSDTFNDYLQGNITAAQANESLARVKGGGDISKIINQMEGMDPEKKKKVMDAGKQYAGLRGAEVSMKQLGAVQSIAAQGPESVGGLEAKTGRAFTDLARLYKGGSDETLNIAEAQTAQKEAEALANNISRTDAERLGREGGAVGKQVAAMKIAKDDLKGPLSEDALSEFQKKMGRLGYDLKAMGGDKFEELAKGGIKSDEVGKFQDLVSKITKGNLVGAQGNKQSMEEQLRMYTIANTRFVEAVGKAMNRDVKDFAKEMVEAGRQLVNGAKETTPAQP